MQVKLKVLSGTHAGKDIVIQQDKFLIGRSDSCQLRPKSESISRKHCALVQKNGQLLALDLKSRNGTFVNDKQLSPEKAKILKNGDKLKVGQLEFEVLIEVTLGGAKKPEVRDVKEAAERVVENNNDSRYVEIDINSWLEEADQIDRQAPSQDTRQFMLDESHGIDVTIAASNDETKMSDAASSSGDSSDSSADSKAEKKAPLKLPKIVKGPTSKNSRDAASETLKKYFGGRG